ncbi:MAG: carboxypeptidase regulatory-like domain-containing protein [Flavobacteriales bacterium]|nr:carboxypeptidase regulatory-like domain-containing protein [Flavobacteriales bacterium]
MLKRLAVLVSMVFFVLTSFAQGNQGTIKGKMLDKDNGEPLAFANVVLMKGGSQVAGTMTDFDGKFTFTALTPGKYTVQATYVGYQPIQVNDIVVSAGQITFMKDIKASSGAENLEEFVVIDYEVPLISKDQTSSGGTITAEEIKKMPGRSAASIAATVGGVYSTDDGSSALSVRGARTSGTTTYIDGIKVRGTQNLPNSAIDQVSVITGGIPAQYGDATGGIVNITTRGASKEWFGGIEYLTSGFKTGDKVVGLDKFGFNLLAGSISGPIKTRKDSLGNKKDAIAGFFLSGEAKHEVDPRPFYGGDWKVKDDVMDSLNATPYIQNLSEAGGVINSASYLTFNDMEQTPFRLNVARKSLNLAGKIDITTSKTTNVSVGGSFDYRDGNDYVRGSGTAYSLLNSANNPQSIDRTWRVYGRFTQRFANSSDEENPSLIKDAFINFQIDYSNYNFTNQDERHKDQLSHYGYIGKFTTTYETTYDEVDSIYITDSNGDTVSIDYGFLSNQNSILYSYEAGDINPILANYTSSYYDVYANDPEGHWDDINNVRTFGGLVNGDNPADVYGMWSSMGRVSNGYTKQDQSQFRVSAQGSATIKDHALQIGFEYEQRDDRFYSAAPVGLWNLGRQLVNTQLQQRDYTVGTFTQEPWTGGFDRFTFIQAYDPTAHSTFDKNLRESLGLPVDGREWIDFDSYGPDVWNIGMFSPDELITNGGYVNNFGYDHTGAKLSGNPSVDDFFTKQDDNGNYLRENPAFRPIYVAGFIQDKFAFDDLIFNVGIRIDRYDANQSVLKDKYSLFPVKTVGEIEGLDPIGQNIGDDFVVYVADAANPTIDDVVGYRDGDVWYNKEGELITDPSILSSSGVPQPWLVDPNDDSVFEDLDGESFKDYEPQVNISPRIAFSFPISDEALFFAHYDVLTQRPESNNRMDLISYLAFGSGGTNIFGGYFNNPALRAQKTIDYELGFQQKLDNYSALKIAAFYRENRDQVQTRQIIGAFPGNYFTFDNLDFGTVKGVTITYDLRTRGNISMNASYTLQFADGTGSSTTTSQNLVSSGNGNLRTLIPLSFDQRHRITLRADYRYGSGKNYNGPVLFGKDILQNTGLNVTMRAGSGTPYTKRSRVNGSGILFTSQGTSPQEGQLNASRLPFNTTFDAKIDRTIDLKWGKGEGEDRKEATLNIYIQTLNLLNSKNIIGVYASTGNPDDDGFLAASYQQQYIVNQIDETSFRNLYEAKLQNGFNYALPRRIRLGIQLNF